MGQLNKTGMRRLTSGMADYEGYITCNYYTGYSHVVGQKSDKLSDDLVPSYEAFEEIFKQNKAVDHQLGCLELVYETEDGKVVAYADIQHDKKNHTVAILEFIVAQDYQLKGYGRKFYQAIEEAARDKEVCTITVQTAAYGAIKFWHKMGFYGNGFLAKNI